MGNVCSDQGPITHNLATLALHRMAYAKNDSVMKVGHQAKHMTLLINGELKYKKGLAIEHIVYPEDWLCEAALWCVWVQRGNAMAVNDSTAILVEYVGFFES